ncbi:EamA family transporter [Stenotrophomonas sp. ISL-67]|uniref:DMT family transporter n=1 Tax=Stenotrophomonas sp. ISL-67 TaxID=2819171 RepID=UPI001BEA289F|nr:DMT family transporter [Stenotrophomonas sp. ISL-67]MBT2767485.1 EamA family transporter [Stenotrophomonas sp. ISL-67]
MSSFLFCTVLVAGLLHASWNAIVKRGSDTLFTTVLVTGSAALIAALCLPFVAAPDPRSWPWLAMSTVLQAGYYVLVARTYRLTDMSAAYPLMRGCAPIVVALLGGVLLGERLPGVAWAGIGLICVGILCMAHGIVRRQMWLPLIVAGVIATYTMVDAWGARQSGSAVGYTLWLFLLSGLPLPIWALCTRVPQLSAYARANWGYGVVGGVGTLTSYGVVLWAMTQAPVAMISALRETSILFGVLISALVLRERVTRRRWMAAGLIVAGAVLLRLCV